MKQTKEKGGLGAVLRRKLAAAPVFWQYFILLMVILILATAIQFISSTAYNKVITQNYLQQAESSFRQDCRDLGDMLYAGYTVPTVMDSSGDFSDLQELINGSLPATSHAIVMKNVQENLSSTVNLTAAKSAREYFLYLPEYDMLFTRERSYNSAKKAFSEGIVYASVPAEDMLPLLETRSLVHLLPLCPVTLRGQQTDCLTVLLHPTGSSGVLGVLYDNETLQELFNMPAMPEGTSLHIADAEGTSFFSWGEKTQEAVYEFRTGLRGTGLEAVLKIPRSYFTQLMRPTQITGMVLMGLTLLLGIGLCYGFSKVWAAPLGQLLSSYGMEKEDGVSRNELHRLADLLSTSRLESDTVNQTLNRSVLVRVLSGGVLAEKEEQRLTQRYPAFSQPCRIAIIHSTSTTEEFGQTEITELISEHLPEHFAAVTVNNLETGVVLPDEPDALHELARILAGVNSQLGVDGLSVLCGVSAPFTGVHSAYAAVRQARFSIPIRESSYIEVYSVEEPGDERPGVFSWLTHERLYQAVMKNDRDDTVQFIRALGADKYYSLADAKEVFYSVRFVIRSTAGELHIAMPEADALEYREEMRSKENFRKLEDLVCLLFDRLHARQATTAMDATANLVAYITENFRNPELSANSVAAHFSVPVKTVYSAVRDTTEMNMADFIIHLRMKEAAKLLCTTQRSVDEIAAACGYPAQSTFYRVFKNFYGESPNKYRTLH